MHCMLCSIHCAVYNVDCSVVFRFRLYKAAFLELLFGKYWLARLSLNFLEIHVWWNALRTGNVQCGQKDNTI